MTFEELTVMSKKNEIQNETLHKLENINKVHQKEFQQRMKQMPEDAR